MLQELVGQDRVAGHLAHHDQAQAVHSTLESALGQHLRDPCGLFDRAHKGDHDLHIAQPHVVAHPLEGFALHGEGVAELAADVAAGPPKTQHRVLFIGLVAAATDELAVLVALEVRQPHDHRLGPEGRRNGGDPFGQLVDIEGLRAGVAARHGLHRQLEVGIDVGVVQDRLGVHANVVVDDELQAGQANAGIGHLRKIKRQLWVAHIHHDLDGAIGHFAALDFADLGLQQSVVDHAGVALGAHHGHQSTIAESVGRIPTTDHGRNAQLARNDGCMAGTPTAVGDDRAGPLHHRLPVRVGHVGNQHVTRLNPVHLRDRMHQAHRPGPDLLADRATFSQGLAAALELVAVFHLTGGLALDRLGPGLQHVQPAVLAILAPLDVHWAAIVLLDDQGVLCQLGDVGIRQGVAMAQFGWCVLGLHQPPRGTAFGFRGEGHPDELAAQVAPNHGPFTCAQSRLVNIELIGVHSPLHHGLAQPVAAGDEDHILEPALGVDREHDTGRTQIGPHHALDTSGQGDVGMGEALVHPVADGTVVVE